MKYTIRSFTLWASSVLFVLIRQSGKARLAAFILRFEMTRNTRTLGSLWQRALALFALKGHDDKVL